jgi:hypothetical protein
MLTGKENKLYDVVQEDMPNHKILAEVILLVLQRFTNFIVCVNKAGLEARAEL